MKIMVAPHALEPVYVNPVLQYVDTENVVAPHAVIQQLKIEEPENIVMK